MFIQVDGHGRIRWRNWQTVKRFYEQASSRCEQAQPCILDRAWLRRLALDCGADDAGLVEALGSTRNARGYLGTSSSPGMPLIDGGGRLCEE